MTKFLFTGDFCPWSKPEELLQKSRSSSYFLEEIKDLFKNVDYKTVDLECPLTTSGSKINKTGPHLKADPKTVELLSYLGVDLVATANNHFMDFGDQGAIDTYATLSAHGIDYIGSGEKSQLDNYIKYIDFIDCKVSIINMAENEWSTYSEDRNYGCLGYDPITSFNLIRKAKENSDHVIVIAHGGHEHYPLPSPVIQRRYRYFIDIGASAVISHHTHIISGYEVYRNAPIFYGLGNFFFHWPGSESQDWARGMLVELEIDKKSPVGFNLYFVEYENTTCKLKLLSKEQENKIHEKIKRYNEIIRDLDLLEKSFDEYATGLKSIMSTRLQPYRGKVFPSLYKRGLIPEIIGSQKKKLLTNLIRCESHREVLLHSLKNSF